MTELRPNKNLLNPFFDSYKLASTSLTVNTIPLIPPVNIVSRNPNQFSYIYVRSHEMHNSLHLDTWNDLIYVVDAELKIKALYLKEDGKAHSMDQVFVFPPADEKRERFNSSITFPSSTLAVLSDGSGLIYLLQTGNRKLENLSWKNLKETPIYDVKCPAYVLLSCLDEKTNVVHVLVSSFKELKQEADTCTHSYVVLHWLKINITLENPAESSVTDVKTFLSKNLPTTYWFNENFTRLMLVCDKKFNLVDKETLEIIEPSKKVENSKNGDVQLYHWHQSKELVSISFDIPTTESEVQCNIKHNSIVVKLANGTVLLEGNLEKEVFVDASKWYIEKHRLEVVLIKKVSNEFWLTVVPTDGHGFHDIEGEEEERIREVHEGLAHLTSEKEILNENDANTFNMQQLEDCDANMEELKFYSIDAETGQVDTQTNFGGSQWLFNTQVDVNGVPLICLRHDVDGVLWKASRNEQNAWEHISTFDALGYVQASKEEHKFTTCSPCFDYAIITDCTSHIYIYVQNKEDKKKHDQYVTSLMDCERILGCQATHKHAFVLTDKHLNVITLP